ncbi:phospholipid carrier-dependent glycosyltransferase [Candidatus Peribacteria bacterium]|nr:phospholipid carrier-dependent glycosyltransferase [Candidatus Peribacteria bacterium]
MSAKTSTKGKWHAWLFLGFVLLLSYFTYFHRYWDPPRVFWDENYHIASAQKYLHNVYFMEQHPPLGKLLIALGEKIFHPNEKTDQFLATDYGTEFDDGFSFAGYRFFSALFAWWTAPVLFLIFLALLRNPLHSVLLSFFYIFDNALIVHTRGAMLEGPLSFFAALTILFFILTLRDRGRTKSFLLWSILFGVSFGLMVSTKVLGLAFILLTLPILWKLWPRWKRAIGFLAIFGTSALVVFLNIWWIHFSLGQRINTELPDGGYYQASDTYKDLLATGHTSSLTGFPVMLRDSLAYIPFYNRGAPRLDFCKEDENGSPPWMWPLGARTINYRWETPDSSAYLYLYLVPNPVVWWTALAAVLVAASMLVCSVVAPPKRPLKNRFLLFVFLGLYLSFMIAVSRIPRVLYLYHYFIPLLVSFVLVALVFNEIQSLWRKPLQEHGKTILALTFAALIFLGHQYYRPFTYYEPLTDAQFNRRNILNLWDMRCVNCERNSSLVVPTKEPN